MNNKHRLPLFFAVSFFTLLSFSTVVTVLIGGISQASYAEYRQTHGLPEFPHDRATLTSFAPQFDAFMRDNFGFRESYFQVVAYVCRVLGITPGNYQVVRGRDNWFFTAEDQAFAGYSPRFYLSDSDVARWRDYLAAKHRWAASVGAHYFFMVAPNSNTIYHDKVPALDTVDIMQSRMSQIVDSVQQFNAAQQPVIAPFIVDPRVEMFRVRKTSPHDLYYRTDVHWNSAGAAAGYRALMASIQQTFPTIRVDQYPDSRFLVTDRNAKGYVRRFAAGEDLHDHEVEITGMPDCTGIAGFQPLADPYNLGSMRAPMKTTCPAGHPLKVLVFHDSFFRLLQPMLSAQFQDVSYIWIYSNDDAVYQYYAELVKPDIIIEEVAERYLGNIRSTSLGASP